MSAYIKGMLWAFLFGITTGGLMAISINYPVTEKAIADVNGMCAANDGVRKFTVGLSGKIYSVQCKNDKTFNLK